MLTLWIYLLGVNCPGWRSRCSDSLQSGRSGYRIPVGEIFPAPVQTCGTVGTRSFAGVKRKGCGVEHPPPSSAEVKEIVDLHLYSNSGSSWSVLGWTFTFTFIFTCTLFIVNNKSWSIQNKYKKFAVFINHGIDLELRMSCFLRAHSAGRVRRSTASVGQPGDVNLNSRDGKLQEKNKIGNVRVALSCVQCYNRDLTISYLFQFWG